MANSLSVLNPTNWRRIVQDYLNNMLVAREIANSRFYDELKDGQVIEWPETTDLRVQSYSAGTDLTIDDTTATSSQMTINSSRAVTYNYDPVQVKQAKANWAMDLAKQAAHRMANDVDRSLISTGVSAVSAGNTIAGGTVSTSTMLSLMTQAKALLFRNNATDGELFCLCDADRIALLTQTFIQNGFQVSDTTLRNSFEGMSVGFKVYSTNNLPTSVTLTVDTNPTANDTMTIYGITWTFKASAAAAGEITIGANAAATQTNIVNALTGSGSGFVDVSVTDRRKLYNMYLSCSAFASNVATLTGVGKIAGSETFTAGTNIFGTETTQMLFGRRGAVSLGMQIEPTVYLREEPKQLVTNHITHTLYGTKVFSRDVNRLVKVSHNM